MGVEDDIKTEVNNASWSGLTQTAYVYSKEHTNSLNLNKPVLTDDLIQVVIYKADRSIREQLYNSDLFLFSGLIKMWAQNTTDLDSAILKLKDVGDVYVPKGSLMFLAGGVEGDGFKERYFSNVLYEWMKYITRT